MTLHISRRTLIAGSVALPVTAAAAAIAAPSASAFGAIGREDVLNRARYRISKNLPYRSEPPGYYDGYREDCSGFVAYAWGAWAPGRGTSEMEQFGAFRIAWNDLQPGDAVNNPLPGASGHVMIFSHWINDADRNVFQAMEHTGSGERIYNHSRTELQASYHPVRYNGVDILKPYGLINAKWLQGNNRSIMGNPTNDEFSTNPAGSGRFRDFQNGMIIWKRGAAAPFLVHGLIFSTYRNTGSEKAWGFPTMDELDAGASPTGTKGRYQYFEGALILWSQQTGAHLIHGEILKKFERSGREGQLGYPLADEEADGAGRKQRFEKATIRWTATGGAVIESV
ncbi:hypothetical protein [Flexivirga meconopsidis]|uniref:hypothetical protein n=1 Tax=Flexivirga meconopsidis TaxID=2977121 RepID=UPI0022409ADF|nr:hypothetical protein [Flexivirga meconopsidis]